MRNGVRFDSEKFNTTEPKDYFINDICFGDDLAYWLSAELKKRNIETIELWQEDWGWQFEAGNCLISIAFTGDEEWRIEIQPILGFFDKLRGKTVNISGLTGSLHEILKTEFEISGIEWFHSDKFGRKESDFASEP